LHHTIPYARQLRVIKQVFNTDMISRRYGLGVAARAKDVDTINGGYRLFDLLHAQRLADAGTLRKK